MLNLRLRSWDREEFIESILKKLWNLNSNRSNIEGWNQGKKKKTTPIRPVYNLTKKKLQSKVLKTTQYWLIKIKKS